jgi:hypothetical protein
MSVTPADAARRLTARIEARAAPFSLDLVDLDALPPAWRASIVANGAALV